MEEIASTDTRGFHMLLQGPEQVGYYTYGTPGGGAAQFAHPKLLSLICRVESLWQAEDGRKLGIGNISVAGGTKMRDHRSHRSGLDVDVRPLRRDRKNMRVTRFDKLYDRDATAKLIGLFLDFGEVEIVYFNDLRIHDVKLVVATLSLCYVSLAKAIPSWDLVYKPIHGHFGVIGGSIGDPYAPTLRDKKVLFSLEGTAAKEMFDAIGPDIKGTCGTEDGGRVRQKQSLSCRYRKGEGHVCDFGLDLTTGKTVPGSTC